MAFFVVRVVPWGVLGAALGGPRGVPAGPRRVPGGPRVVHAGSLEALGGSGGSPGIPGILFIRMIP